MADWKKQLDDFLTLYEYDKYNEAGTISTEQAREKAYAEYDKFRLIQDEEFLSDFDKEKIFDAYYRSNNTLQIKGEGIGLFVVKENITLLQGKIVVESELDKGSNFTIEIPLILKEQIKI